MYLLSMRCLQHLAWRMTRTAAEAVQVRAGSARPSPRRVAAVPGSTWLTARPGEARL